MEGRPVIAYKFLGLHRTALYSGSVWPLGDWIEADGPLALCRNGVHGCRGGDLPGWLDDELWIVELDGELEEDGDVVLARRGRLVRRVDAWDGITALAFAESCVRRMHYQAVSALELVGRAEDAARLARVRGLDEIQTLVLELGGAETAPDELLALLADAVELIRGGRPDAYRAELGSGAPTPGAIAANLGFVVAHAFGRAAVEAAGDDEAYAVAFGAERARQRDWLREHLWLETYVPA